MYLRILAVLGCLWGNALGGYSQLFYTGLPFQQTHNYYRPPLPAYQPYIPTPVFYNPVPQIYTHSGFAYHHTAPTQAPIGLPPSTVQGENNNDGVRINEESDSVEVNAEPVQRSETQTQAPVPAPIATRTFNFERKESNAFRGFAYHTEYEDGARSNVVFLTGPEIHNFQSPIEKSNTHTPASDALDTNALQEETEKRRIDQNPSIRVLMDFLENPRVGVQKFYSVDNNLIARRLEDDYPMFPANTMPLNQPVSPIFSILRSNFNQEPQQELQRNIQENLLRTSQDNLAQQENIQVQQRSNPEPLPLASEIKTNTVDPDATTTTTTTTTSAPSTTTVEALSTEKAASSTETSTTMETSSSTTSESTTSSSSMDPIIVE